MQKQKRKLTTLLTVLLMLNGVLPTVAEITITFDIHGTSTGSTGNTEESKEKRAHQASVSNSVQTAKQVTQRKDTSKFKPVIINRERVSVGINVNTEHAREGATQENNLRKSGESSEPVKQSKEVSSVRPIVINERIVGDQNGISKPISKNEELPLKEISKIQEAIEIISQKSDVGKIIPVIPKEIVITQNVNLSNKSIDKTKPVPAVSVRQGAIKHVNKDLKAGKMFPKVINDTFRASVDVTRESTASGKGTLKSLVSEANSLAPVNQSRDINDILPVDINTPNIMNQLSQRKDVNAIKPVMIDKIRVAVGRDAVEENIQNGSSQGGDRQKFINSFKPVDQSTDFAKLKPIIVEERKVENQSFVSNSTSNDRDPPISAISKRQEGTKSLNQTTDEEKDIIPVVPKNVNFAKELNDKVKPVSFISVRQGSVRHVNKDESSGHNIPIMINETNYIRDGFAVDRKPNGKGSLKILVSGSNFMTPLNQSDDTNNILPVLINSTRNVNNGESVLERTTVKISVSRTRDKIGHLNQSKDTGNNVTPDYTGIGKLDVDNPVDINKSENKDLFTTAVSFVNTTKAVNQIKDISSVFPIVTNATNVIGNVNVTKENVKISVHQANDNNVLTPIETKITHVGEDVRKDTDGFNATVPPPVIAIDDKVQHISDIPSIDLRKRYNSIDTEFCITRNRCNSTVPSRSCYCDSLCSILKDCCEDAETLQDLNLDFNQLSCTHVKGISSFGSGLVMVSKCLSEWNDDVTRKLCESDPDSNDIYSQVPVADQTGENILYKNRHCAHCNNIFKYEFLKADVKCIENNGSVDISYSQNCEISFQMPNSSATFRTCETDINIISTCIPTFKGKDIRQKCVDDFYSITYTDRGDIYRNKYCAICNGENEWNMYCQPPRFFAVERTIPNFVYSFRMIVDFNSKWDVKNDERTPFKECHDNEIYDPFSKSCREIVCPTYTIPLQGNCEPVSQHLVGIMNNRTMFNTTENCTLTKLEESEFEFLNNSNVITFRDISFGENEYWKNGSDVLVCLERLNISATDASKFRNLYPYSPVESYVSFIGLLLSIIASVITLSVYIMFPQQLLNTPGKNVMCLTITLAVSQVLFLIASQVVAVQYLCVTVAILMHYFFLCSFCWMNVIAFDLWVTFSHKFISIRNQSSNSKRFHYYSLYAWCLPLLIVGVADILNFVEFDGKSTNSFVPNYGQGICWITSRNALLLFFAGPLAIFKVFDFISFGFTAYHITRARTQGTFARKGTSASTFIINLRLSLVMGLTWVFAFIANFTNNTIMWYFFIICNTLQGLFIAISFLCTRKVLNIFREKYENKMSRSSETQMTTRPSYKSSE